MKLRKWFYLMGEKRKNPHIRPLYRSLMQTDFASKERLEAIQLEKLKALLRHAYRYAPHYREKIEKSGIDIDSMILADLARIPSLSKRDLREDTERIRNNPSREPLIKSETSGSTGDAFVFYRNPLWDAAARAAQLRGYTWHHVAPWEKNIYFWGFNPSWKRRIKMRILDFLLNRYRIFSFNAHTIDKAAKILKRCSYVEGYSSAVYMLAKALDERGMRFSHIKMVKGTSEKIYDAYQESVKRVFGVNMISEYGAAETGIIAFECPYGSMHIAMENVIVEIVDNKILVTNLYSYSLPIIRYELGDYVVMSNKRCTCGRAHPIIEEVTGRIGKKIYGETEVYPTLTLYNIFKNIALEHHVKLGYFGKQYKKGQLVLDVIIAEKSDKSQIRNYILKECKKYFGSDMDIDIQFVDNVERKQKKLKDFESFVQEDERDV